MQREWKPVLWADVSTALTENMFPFNAIGCRSQKHSQLQTEKSTVLKLFDRCVIMVLLCRGILWCLH